MKLTASNKKRLSAKIGKLINNEYFPNIPVKELAAIVDSFGGDANELSGIYCGREGRSDAQVFENSQLFISWYRMESGRYEITAYMT
mgnify:CR=1 FL=1